MASVVTLLVAVGVVVGVLRVLRTRGKGLVAIRGLSVGADLAAMGDHPQACVQTVRVEGPGRVRLVLAPTTATSERARPNQEYLVALDQGEFALDVLEQWRDGGHRVAVVDPNGGRILRLRSVEDLQHLTLRCLTGL